MIKKKKVVIHLEEKDISPDGFYEIHSALKSLGIRFEGAEGAEGDIEISLPDYKEEAALLEKELNQVFEFLKRTDLAERIDNGPKGERNRVIELEDNGVTGLTLLFSDIDCFDNTDDDYMRKEREGIFYIQEEEIREVENFYRDNINLWRAEKEKKLAGTLSGYNKKYQEVLDKLDDLSKEVNALEELKREVNQLRKGVLENGIK